MKCHGQCMMGHSQLPEPAQLWRGRALEVIRVLHVLIQFLEHHYYNHNICVYVLCIMHMCICT